MSQVKVHKQLENESFRFCKVEKKGKKPFEQGWSKKGYKWNDPALQAWLDSGGNYGCLGGHGDLVIFDADDLARVQELGIIALLPESLTVRTPGRGGWHIYLVCPGIEKKLALYDPEKTTIDAKGRQQYVHVADLVAKGMQAVGPGSIREISREDGTEIRFYEIVKDVPIAEITKDQLREALKLLKQSPRVEKKSEKAQDEVAPAQSGYKRWADGLHVEDVMFPDNVVVDNLETTGELQGSHPIHGSENGRNFAINIKKNNWVCFRCHPPEGKGEGKDYCGGGPWELLGIREGIITCDDCYKGWRRDQPEKWAAILRRAKDLGIEVPRLPDGDSTSEWRRDIIRYATEIIMGSEHVKTSKSGEIYLYEGGAYRPGGEGKLAALIEQLGGQQTTNNVVAEVIGKIKRLTTVDFLEFDTDPYKICVKNGILNLLTGQLEPHSPDFLTVIQIPVNFKPSANCPTIKTFMTEIVRSEDLAVMEEMAGYCLFKNHKIHKGFLLSGEGRNGKSTWVNLLIAMVSLVNCANVPMQFLSKKFRNAELQGKLINFYTDLPDISMGLTDSFKIVTSGDPMTIERKFREPEKIISYSKQIFSANALPKTMDESYGFFSRIILIDFPNRFENGNADISLMDKLTTPEELSGFLNLAISGLRRLLENGKFSYDKEVDDVAEIYKARTSPGGAIKDFMGVATLKSSQDWILKDELWLAYLGWSLETGEDIIKSKEELLRDVYKHYPVSPSHPHVEVAPGIRKQKWAVRGIAFTEEGIRLMNLGKGNSLNALQDSMASVEA